MKLGKYGIFEQEIAGASLASVPASAADLSAIEALRRGDEAAFVMLTQRYYSSMLRLAMIYVPSREVAEEVVQETWMGVLQSIGRFEGRSSLKTWLFRILMNRARMRGTREARTVPFSAFYSEEEQADEPAVDPVRFRPVDDPQWPHPWAMPSQPWRSLDAHLLSEEMQAYIQLAIEALPANQCEVISLRDIQGWDSKEACNCLGISETNQRVLLHRARAKVRQALEHYIKYE